MLSVNAIGPVGLDSYYTSLVGRPDNGARNTVTAAGLETPILAARAFPSTSAPALYPADAPLGQTATTRIGSVNVPAPAEQTQRGANATDAATQTPGLSSLSPPQQTQPGDGLFENLRGLDNASRTGINAQPGIDNPVNGQPGFGLDAQTTNSLGALQTAQQAQQDNPATAENPADSNGDGAVNANEAFEYQQIADLTDQQSPFSNLFGAAG